jgi:hypothetical protein
LAYHCSDTIATSSDGVSWTFLGNTTFTAAGNDVVFSEAQQRWVAVGVGENSIAWSPAAVNETSWVGLGTAIFDQEYGGRAVAFSVTQERWVAVGHGSNATIAWSDDGIIWHPIVNSAMLMALKFPFTSPLLFLPPGPAPHVFAEKKEKKKSARGARTGDPWIRLPLLSRSGMATSPRRVSVLCLLLVGAVPSVDARALPLVSTATPKPSRPGTCELLVPADETLSLMKLGSTGGLVVCFVFCVVVLWS